MNCPATQELFSDYFDGGLSATERQRLEAHLKDCPTCRTEYDHYSTSLKILSETRPLETTQVFMANVKAAAQAHLERKELFVNTAAPAPRRALPAWVPFAIAASALAAFLTGWLLQSGSLERQMADLRRDLERAREEAQRPPPPAPVVPTDEEILRKYGLERAGAQWVPSDLKAALEKRMVILDGKPLEPEAAARELLARFPPPEKPRPPDPPKPPPEDPAKREEEVLKKHGLVRLGDRVVPAEWAENWAKDLVQTGVNQWKTREELEKDFVEKHKLVRVGGRLMTQEQAQELANQQLVKRPDAATAANEVTQALEGLQIGPRLTYRGLTAYLLLSSRPPADPAVTPLHAALATGKLELLEKGEVFSIQVRNQLESDVLLVAGEVLAGGRCARVVAEDTLVPRKKTVPVPTYCVEPGVWRASGPFFKESGHYVAPPSVRRMLAGEQGQGALWALLARRLEKGRAGQIDLFRKYADTLADYRPQFSELVEQEPAAVGVVLALGDTVEHVEVFRTNALLNAYFDRLVAGAVLDLLERSTETATSRSGPAFPNNVKGVKQFLESAFSLSYDLREGGFAVRKDDVRVGRACVAAGGVQHAALFAAGPPEWDRRALLGVPNDKIAKVLVEVEERMKNGDVARKVEAVKEIASIRVPAAVAVLVNHLNEPTLAVRRAILQSIGEIGDRRAYEPVAQLLAKSRKDLAVFTEAAHALARLGDERGVDLLIRQADAGDSELAKVVVLALPDLLLQVRSRDTLERAVGRVVSIHESAYIVSRGEAQTDPMTKGLPPAEALTLSEAARAALRQVTGQDLSSAAAYRKWWNDRETRDRFLRERTGK